MSLACGWDAPTVPWSSEAPFSLGGGGEDDGSRGQDPIQGKPQAAASCVRLTGREGEGEGEGRGGEGNGLGDLSIYPLFIYCHDLS